MKHWRDKTTETHEIRGVGHFTHTQESERTRVAVAADAKATGQ